MADKISESESVKVFLIPRGHPPDSDVLSELFMRGFDFAIERFKKFIADAENSDQDESSL